MSRLIVILRHYRKYIYWKAKVSGRQFDDILWTLRQRKGRGSGYPIVTDLFGHNPYEKLWKPVTAGGKTGIYNLMRYESFDDFRDVVRISGWNFIGYEGMKPIRDCSFEEYLELYGQTESGAEN